MSLVGLIGLQYKRDPNADDTNGDPTPGNTRKTLDKLLLSVQQPAKRKETAVNEENRNLENEGFVRCIHAPAIHVPGFP